MSADTLDPALKAKILARKRAGRESAPKPDELVSQPAARKNPGLDHPDFIKQKWKPGQSGNPKGRPKNPSLEEILRKYLGEKISPDADGTRLEAMAKVVFSEGITKRNAKVMIALLDRLWPKPIKIQGDVENPILVTQITRRVIDESGNPDT